MIKDLVKEAGEILISSRPESLFEKGIGNFATEVDLKIQRFLMKELKELYPDCGFYGEEDIEGSIDVDHSVVFYIDPIDGTTNYLFDYHHSCVSVGVARDGEIVEGYVFDPYKDEFFEAYKGKGSFLNGKRLEIKHEETSKGILAFGLARYNEDHMNFFFEFLKRAFFDFLSLRNGGSSTLDLCRIAKGSNNGYIELLLQPYDYAAASLIIKEAGGFISDLKGDEVSLSSSCGVIAGNYDVHRYLLDSMRDLEN